MHCPAPICSDLSYLVFGCNNLYSVTFFPKQGKMEQVRAGCSSKMVVIIRVFYYRKISSYQYPQSCYSFPGLSLCTSFDGTFSSVSLCFILCRFFFEICFKQRNKHTFANQPGIKNILLIRSCTITDMSHHTGKQCKNLNF